MADNQLDVPIKKAKIVLAELKRLFPDAHTILNFSNKWQLLVAVMLSAQTTDKQVNKTTAALFKKYKTLDSYVCAKPDEFVNAIRSINYYKTKAKHILESARIVQNMFHGVLPRTVEQLMILPGVGRKTALVVLGNAYSITEGIAVDTYVARLAHVFDLSQQQDTKKIETDLCKLFPKEEWLSLTNRMIEYGRQYCNAHCSHENCPIMAKIRNI